MKGPKFSELSLKLGNFNGNCASSSIFTVREDQILKGFLAKKFYLLDSACGGLIYFEQKNAHVPFLKVKLLKKLAEYQEKIKILHGWCYLRQNEIFFWKRILIWIHYWYGNSGIFSFVFMSHSKGFLALK